MILFFTKDECNDIIKLSDNLKFKNDDDFGNFSYSFINKSWVIDRIVDIFEKNKKIKISQRPIVRIIKLDIGNYLPAHTFNYKEGEYKNTTNGTYIFLNNDVTGGDFYINGKLIEKETGKGTIQSIDTKVKISKILKNKLYLIVVNYYKMQVTTII